MSNLDIVPILEWAERKRREGRTFTSTSSKTKTPDLVELLQKEIRRNADLEQFFKDLEKMRKKEEKKKDGAFDKLSTTQLTIIMVVTVPIYLVMLMKLLT